MAGKKNRPCKSTRSSEISQASRASRASSAATAFTATGVSTAPTNIGIDMLLAAASQSGTTMEDGHQDAAMKKALRASIEDEAEPAESVGGAKKAPPRDVPATLVAPTSAAPDVGATRAEQKSQKAEGAKPHMATKQPDTQHNREVIIQPGGDGLITAVVGGCCSVKLVVSASLMREKCTNWNTLCTGHPNSFESIVPDATGLEAILWTLRKLHRGPTEDMEEHLAEVISIAALRAEMDEKHKEERRVRRLQRLQKKKKRGDDTAEATEAGRNADHNGTACAVSVPVVPSQRHDGTTSLVAAMGTRNSSLHTAGMSIHKQILILKYMCIFGHQLGALQHMVVQQDDGRQEVMLSHLGIHVELWLWQLICMGTFDDTPINFWDLLEISRNLPNRVLIKQCLLILADKY